MSRYVAMDPAEGKPGTVYYPLSLREAPVPALKAREVLIKMAAAALNHRDLFLRQHLYPGTAFNVPLLADGAGIVVAVGDLASQRWLHKRVVINPGSGWTESSAGPEELPGGWYRLLGGTKYNPKGTLTEFLVIDEGDVEEAPAHLTDVEAAALPVTGLTAWRALTTKCGEEHSQPGSTILVTGIGGGVALMVLEFAVARGVDVWVSSSSQQKLEKARQIGAKGGVNYREAAWEEKLLTLLPPEKRYFDAIIDGTGGDVVQKGLRLLKAGGVIVVYGMTLAPQMPFTMQAVLRNLEVRGTTMGSRKEFGNMVDFVKEKKIRPTVSRVVEGIDNFDAIESLFQDLKHGRQFGKLVITLSADATRGKL